jgi:hypothetical protein
MKLRAVFASAVVACALGLSSGAFAQASSVPADTCLLKSDQKLRRLKKGDDWVAGKLEGVLDTEFLDEKTSFGFSILKEHLRMYLSFKNGVYYASVANYNENITLDSMTIEEIGLTLRDPKVVKKDYLYSESNGVYKYSGTRYYSIYNFPLDEAAFKAVTSSGRDRLVASFSLRGADSKDFCKLQLYPAEFAFFHRYIGKTMPQTAANPS